MTGLENVASAVGAPDATRHPRAGHLRALCVLVLALAVLATACGGGGTDTTPAAAAAKPAAIGQEDFTKLPESTTFETIPAATQDPTPDQVTEGKVLHPKRDLVVYDAPAGKAVAKLPTLQVGSPTWVPVIAEQGAWAHVMLPSRPNGSTGWLYTGDGTVETARNDYQVTVELATFQLTLNTAGAQPRTWKVGIGKPEFPTPKGRTFILASIAETVTKFSPIILPLGSHSTSHETFGGGPGTVAIHGWPDDSPIGKADSDGCIRVTKEALDQLSALPLGTVVVVR